MVFSSASFLIFFLPCLLVLYFLVPRRCRYLRNLVLLAFSLAFYACGGPKFLLLMLLSIAINYAGGLLAGPAHRPRTRRLGMTLAVVLGLALLGWFKYAGFFGEMLHALLPVVPVPQVTLPIGISFFTFQGLSYVIDVYRGDAAVQKSPLKLALYISFFPQLVAGPIVRYTTVAEEIDERHESVSEFSAGAVRFLFGLGKKPIGSTLSEAARILTQVDSLGRPQARQHIFLGLFGGGEAFPFPRFRHIIYICVHVCRVDIPAVLLWIPSRRRSESYVWPAVPVSAIML